MFGNDRHACPEFLQQLADDVPASLLNEQINGRKGVKKFTFEFISQLYSVDAKLRVMSGGKIFLFTALSLGTGRR